MPLYMHAHARPTLQATPTLNKRKRILICQPGQRLQLLLGPNARAALDDLYSLWPQWIWMKGNKNQNTETRGFWSYQNQWPLKIAAPYSTDKFILYNNVNISLNARMLASVSISIRFSSSFSLKKKNNSNRKLQLVQTAVKKQSN